MRSKQNKKRTAKQAPCETANVSVNGACAVRLEPTEADTKPHYGGAQSPNCNAIQRWRVIRNAKTQRHAEGRCNQTRAATEKNAPTDGDAAYFSKKNAI